MPKTKIVEFVNSADKDEAAHNEAPHLDFTLFDHKSLSSQHAGLDEQKIYLAVANFANCFYGTLKIKQ